MMAFLNVFWWEFLQNVPFVTATVVALRLWSANQTVWAGLIGMAGCVVTAATITLTEPYKLQTTTGQSVPSREISVAAQIREFITNTLSFAGGTLLVVLYIGWGTQFGSLQNNWITDVAVGGVAAGVVASVQCASPRPAISGASAWPHILAFVVMGPMVLGIARVVMSWPTLLAVLEGSVVLAGLMTLVICCVEYAPSLKASYPP
jgi:hypothetical protein